MQKQIHPNYIKSSDLIFITAVLGIINFFFSPKILSSGFAIIVAIFTLLFIAGLGVLVKQGFSWVKYLLLALLLFGLLGIPFIIKNMTTNPIVGIVNIIQTVLQIWALVLLFKIRKED